eukprot:2244205-Pyramimonas_sp.AAC.1
MHQLARLHIPFVKLPTSPADKGGLEGVGGGDAPAGPPSHPLRQAPHVPGRQVRRLPPGTPERRCRWEATSSQPKAQESAVLQLAKDTDFLVLARYMQASLELVRYMQ